MKTDGLYDFNFEWIFFTNFLKSQFMHKQIPDKFNHPASSTRVAQNHPIPLMKKKHPNQRAL
jgi:hypothetical protein